MAKKIVNPKQKVQFRNIFGYLLFFSLLLFLVLFYFTDIPVGLSTTEMASATISGNLDLVNWLPSQVIDLPYHFIQWLSINIFDISVFSIKLPSIIMAILTGVMVLFIIRELYNTKVAILTGLVTISSMLFLIVARTGAPIIMPVFLSIVAMFAVSRALHRSEHSLRWLLLAGLALALNLYSPMGIYLTVIAVIAASFHPKVRLILFKTKPWKMILAVMILLIAITPLVFGMINDSSIVFELLGVNNFSFAWESIRDNLAAIFWPIGGNHIGIVAPILTMSIAAFMILGIVGAVTNFHSVRSYLSIPMFIVILALSIFNIQAAPLLLIPIILLTAIGINYLLDWWFGLFPRNPYAKAIGIIPLAILFGWMILSGSTRYFEVNFYDKNLVYEYRSNFNVIKNLATNYEKRVIVVTKDVTEKTFYRLAFRQFGNVIVSDSTQRNVDRTILLQSAFSEIEDKKPSQIITNGQRYNSEIIRVFDEK